MNSRGQSGAQPPEKREKTSTSRNAAAQPMTGELEPVCRRKPGAAHCLAAPRLRVVGPQGVRGFRCAPSPAIHGSSLRDCIRTGKVCGPLPDYEPAAGFFNSSGCGSPTRSGGRTPGPLPVAPRSASICWNEGLQPGDDLRMLSGHVGSLADVGFQIIELGVERPRGCAASACRFAPAAARSPASTGRSARPRARLPLK